MYGTIVSVPSLCSAAKYLLYCTYIEIIYLMCFISGYPTVVQTNILIRSMGPVSELDMVRTNFICVRLSNTHRQEIKLMLIN